MLLSYAQNHEDVLLWRAFADVDPAQGFYVDIGANHPDVDSVTKLFYEAGWSGINVEPLEAHARMLEAQRPRDVNLHLAIGASPGRLQFQRVVENDELSTFDEGLAAGYRGEGLTLTTTEVEVRTLADVFDEHVDRDVHFLKIDVEGHEEQVIHGGDWSRHRPYVVLVEATKPELWEHRLEAAGYVRVQDDGINYVFVADEHPELMERLRRPVTVCDRFVHVRHRTEPLTATLATYAAAALADEMLAGIRRPGAGLRTAARTLVEVFTRRPDLIRAFSPDGRVNHLALITWALDIDPTIDPEVGSLQAIRPDIEALRRAWERR